MLQNILNITGVKELTSTEKKELKGGLRFTEICPSEGDVCAFWTVDCLSPIAPLCCYNGVWEVCR